MILHLIINLIILKLALCQVSVQLPQGTIEGFEKRTLGKKLQVFLGVPYAQPPVGDLRFRKPVPLKPSNNHTVIKAKEWPSSCQQAPDLWYVQLANNNFSEDCLYLNIWSPAGSGQRRQPKSVIVFIHGGGFFVGTSSDLTYEGDVLAVTTDVVVVSINYRVNVFGTLYTGTGDEAPGNQGLFDQALAIKWVKDNIARFGGDPNRITIMGQSSGGQSVSAHWLSPVSRKLFNNQVDISGNALFDIAVNRTEAIQRSLNLARLVGCANETDRKFDKKIVKCLKNTQPKKFYKSMEGQDFAYFLYGDEFLPKRPLDMIRDGDFKTDSQLMVATCENEYSPVRDSPALNKTDFDKQDARTFLHWDRLAQYFNKTQLYNYYVQTVPDDHSDALKKEVTIFHGDAGLGCPTKEFGRLIKERLPKSNRVYEFYYTHPIDRQVAEELNLSLKNVWAQFKGAVHGMDLIMLFGWPMKRPDKFTDRERVLADQMMKMLGDFSRKGRPNKIDGVEWPEYYMVNGKAAMPYYEFASKDRPQGNFKWNLKKFACQTLLKSIFV